MSMSATGLNSANNPVTILHASLFSCSCKH